MHLVLSGEGKSDIGLFREIDSEFIAGSMYFIIDKLIEQKYDFSPYSAKEDLITFIPKVELIKYSKKLPPYTGKKGAKGTGYFIHNAIALAKIANQKAKEIEDEVMAVLFRDSDGTKSSIGGMWEDKVDSIEQGFKIGQFDRGVAMVPKPKSEAWLICALKDTPCQQCNKLEERSGNDDSPNNLKDEFERLGYAYNQVNAMIQSGEIDLDKIDMPSFIYFKN